MSPWEKQLTKRTAGLLGWFVVTVAASLVFSAWMWEVPPVTEEHGPATHYRVYWSEQPDEWFFDDYIEVEASEWCGEAECAVPWTDPEGERLYYNVVACNAAGCSEWDHGLLVGESDE